MSAAALRVRDVASPPLQPAVGPSGLSAVVACWLPAADWHSVRGAWQALSDAASPNAFLAPGFALAAHEIDAFPGLGAVAILRDGEWIGFVPGRFSMGGAVFSVWTHDYAPYGLPLVRPGRERLVVDALLAFLSDRRAVALELPFLDDGAFADALAMSSARHTDVLDRHERACLAGAPPPLDKEHRRLARYPLDAALAEFLALEAAGWKGRRATALAARQATRDFFVAAVTGLAATGMARIDLMRVDRRPVAAGVTFLAGDRAWYLKTAYDEAFARFSPGLLLSHAIAEALMTGGRIGLLDSCAVPDHPMINRIWPGRMAVTRRLVAVAAGEPGWRYLAILALRRAALGGRAFAKRMVGRLAKR
jgi:CelD/BcsL family acetyltransferase involved in cellulose biosynthesis